MKKIKIPQKVFPLLIATSISIMPPLYGVPVSSGLSQGTTLRSSPFFPAIVSSAAGIDPQKLEPNIRTLLQSPPYAPDALKQTMLGNMTANFTEMMGQSHSNSERLEAAQIIQNDIEKLNDVVAPYMTNAQRKAWQDGIQEVGVQIFNELYRRVPSDLHGKIQEKMNQWALALGRSPEEAGELNANLVTANGVNRTRGSKLLRALRGLKRDYSRTREIPEAPPTPRRSLGEKIALFLSGYKRPGLEIRDYGSDDIAYVVPRAQAEEAVLLAVRFSLDRAPLGQNLALAASFLSDPRTETAIKTENEAKAITKTQRFLRERYPIDTLVFNADYIGGRAIKTSITLGGFNDPDEKISIRINGGRSHHRFTQALPELQPMPTTRTIPVPASYFLPGTDALAQLSWVLERTSPGWRSKAMKNFKAQALFKFYSEIEYKNRRKRLIPSDEIFEHGMAGSKDIQNISDLENRIRNLPNYGDSSKMKTISYVRRTWKAALSLPPVKLYGQSVQATDKAHSILLSFAATINYSFDSEGEVRIVLPEPKGPIAYFAVSPASIRNLSSMPTQDEINSMAGNLKENLGRTRP